MKLLPCLILPVALLAPSLTAAPGDLDVTLAGTGKMRVLAGGGLDTGYAVARQGDGKLIVAGESRHLGVTVVSLVRYHSNGTLDATFGTGGKVLLTDLFGGARAVGVVPVTGQILVAGYATLSPSNSAFLLARLLSDGTPDTTFDGNGYLFTDITSGLDTAHAMALGTDGRIVLGGETGTQMALARYDANGTLDTSFDGDGKFTSTFARRVHAVLLQGQKIVVAGRTESFGSGAIALRLNFNGSLDTSFSQDGIDVRPEFGHAFGLTLLAVQAGEEKLLLTGGSPGGVSGGIIPVPVPPNFALWSLNAADGSPDTTFGSGGAFSEPDSPGRSVRVQLSGGMASRIVVGTGGAVARRFTLTGGVDSAFGGGTGRASAGFGGDALLVQPDGRIVVAGSDNGDMAIGRFTAGGVLDTSFSSDGVRRDNLSDALASARAIAVQPDGKLLVAGDFTLVRLLPDGSFDVSFDDDGKVSVDFIINALALQADGSVVLAGTGTETTGDGELSIVRLARVNADGAYEFGERATAATPGTALAVRVLTDGKIVVAGAATESLISGGLTIQRFAVFRFLASGVLDQSFGDRGRVVGPAGGGTVNDHSARALALQPDGRIVAAGPWPVSGPSYDFGVVRLLSTGEFDPSFSGDGIAVIPVGTGHDYAEALALHNGRIIIAGTLDTTGDDIGLIRLRTDGELDDSFGIGGKVIASLSSSNDAAKALVVQSDGKLVLCGSSTYLGTTQLSLVRFSENGTPDTTFGTGGQVNIDFTPGNFDAGYAVALDSVQRIVVAGAATDRYGIARVLGDPFLELTGITRHAATGVVTVHGIAAPGYALSLRSAPDLAPASFTLLSALAPVASGAWQVSHAPGTPRLFYKATRP
jgi:uncharacterized delta-60 repeat protein